jgi:hypothetical protein
MATGAHGVVVAGTTPDTLWIVEFRHRDTGHASSNGAFTRCLQHSIDDCGMFFVGGNVVDPANNRKDRYHK